MGDLMRSNDMPRTATDGIDALLMRVEAIKRELRDATNGLLKAAGISVTPTGMTINSALSVTGDLGATGDTTIDGTLDVGAQTVIGGDLDVVGRADFSGNTTIGGTMSVTGDLSATGNTTIGGNAAITGTLSLPAGIIDNDALANPILPEVFGAHASSFATGNGVYEKKATDTLTVPAGFTRAVVSANAIGDVVNTNSYGNFFRVRVEAGSTLGEAVRSPLQDKAGDPRYYATQIAPFSGLITGLTPGASLAISASIFTLAPNVADAGNYASIGGVVLWLR